MESIILSICVISLAASVGENLTAGTRLGKQIKFVFSLILLIVIFKPFAGNTELPELPEIMDIGETAEYSEEIYNNEMLNQIAVNISETLKEELKKNGVNAEFIETEVNISETDSILINRVIAGTDNFSAAERIIKENLGEETEVINAYS